MMAPHWEPPAYLKNTEREGLPKGVFFARDRLRC